MSFSLTFSACWVNESYAAYFHLLRLLRLDHLFWQISMIFLIDLSIFLNDNFL